MEVFPGYLAEIRKEYTSLKKQDRILYQDKLRLGRKITTIVPMLNEEKNIASFINSFRSGNLIIVDNNSSDLSVETAVRTLKKHPGIYAVILSEKLKGVGKARELGAKYLLYNLPEKEYNGRFILCSDSDSRLPRDWERKWAAAIRNNPDSGIFSSNFGLFSDFLEQVPRIKNCAEEIFSLSRFLSRNFGGIYNGVNSCVSCRIYLKLGGIHQTYKNGKPKIDEDVDFGIKALLCGEKFHYTDNAVDTDPRRFILPSFFRYLKQSLHLYRNGQEHADIRKPAVYTDAKDLPPLADRLLLSQLKKTTFQVYIAYSCLADPELIYKNSRLFGDSHKSMYSFAVERKYRQRFRETIASGCREKCQQVVNRLKDEAQDFVKKYYRHLRRIKNDT